MTKSALIRSLTQAWPVCLGLLPIGLLLVIFYPSWAAGKLFLNGDILFNYLSYFQYYASRGPVVAQSILSGFPVMVSVVGMWFYPVTDWSLKIFDAFDAYRYLNLVNLILAYGLTFLYVRRLKFSPLLAIIGATLFVFSGQLMLWGSTLLHTNIYFILPLALLLLEIIRTSPRRLGRIAAWISLGLALGVSWLSGHVQYVVYIHSFVAIYTAWFLVEWRRLASVVRTGLKLALTFLISALVGWPQIGVILTWTNVSARAGGVAVSDYFLGSYYPWDFIHYLWPFFSLPKIPFSNPNLYLGLWPVMILVISLFLWRRIADRHFRFFYLSFLACLLVSFRYSPFGWLLHQLPLYSSFREAPRIMFLGNLAAALMIIFTLRYLLDHQAEVGRILAPHLRFWRRLSIYLLVPLIVVATAIQLFWFDQVFSWAQKIFLRFGYARTAGLPVDYYLAVLKQFLHSALQSFSLLDRQVIASLIFFVAAYWLLKKLKSWSERKWISVALLILILNFGAVYFGYYQYISRADFYAPAKTAEFIKAHQGLAPARFYSLLPGATVYQKLVVGCNSSNELAGFQLEKELLLANLNMQYGLDSIGGYEPFMPRRVSELLGYVGSEQVTTGGTLAEVATSTEQKLATILDRKNILRLMNTRYLIGSESLSDTDLSLRFSEQVGTCRVPVKIYELSNYWPRYFTIDTYQVATSTGPVFPDILAKIQAQGERPLAVLEEVLPIEAGIVKAITPGTSQIVSANLSYEAISFSLELKQPKLLVIGNAWLPGWQATVDGRPAKIYRTNYIYMAVPVLAGRHQLVLSYHYPHGLWR